MMTFEYPTTERLLTHEDWFEGVVSQVRQLQTMYSNNTITKEAKKLINTLIVGNHDEIANLSKLTAQKHFVSQIITDYVELIQGYSPLQMAFSFTDNEVLVWAEIADDDEKTEADLIMAAAKINTKYHKYGYDMTTIFVEESDNLPIPNHYKTFIVKGK